MLEWETQTIIVYIFGAILSATALLVNTTLVLVCMQTPSNTGYYKELLGVKDSSKSLSQISYAGITQLKA